MTNKEKKFVRDNREWAKRYASSAIKHIRAKEYISAIECLTMTLLHATRADAISDWRERT